MIKAHVYRDNKEITSTEVELTGDSETVYNELRGLTGALLIRTARRTGKNPLEVIGILKEVMPKVISSSINDNSNK